MFSALALRPDANATGYSPPFRLCKATDRLRIL